MTRLPLCGAIAGAVLLLLPGTAAADAILDVKLALGPGPLVVDGGAILFGRSNDMDFSFQSGDVGILGPVTG